MSVWPLVVLGDIFDIARGGSPRPIDKFVTEVEGLSNGLRRQLPAILAAPNC